MLQNGIENVLPINTLAGMGRIASNNLSTVDQLYGATMRNKQLKRMIKFNLFNCRFGINNPVRSAWVVLESGGGYHSIAATTDLKQIRTASGRLFFSFPIPRHFSQLARFSCGTEVMAYMVKILATVSYMISILA